MIRDHSTIGIAVTADGSFGELKRNDYLEAENETVRELKEIGKPFVMLLNSARPYARRQENWRKDWKRTMGSQSFL